MKLNPGGQNHIHPLIPPAAALISGQAAQYYFHWPHAQWLCLPAVALLLWAVYLAGVKGQFPRNVLLAAALAGGLALMAFYQAAQVLPANHIHAWADNKYHMVQGQMVKAVQPLTRTWGSQMEVNQVDGQAAQGLLALSIGKDIPLPPVGSQIKAKLRLRPIVNFANPGGYDYAEAQAAQGLTVQAYMGKNSQAVVEPPQSKGLLIRLEQGREYLGALMDHSLPPSEGRGFLRALLLGQRGGLSAQARLAMSETATAHLLAISGLHIGLVWGWCFAFLRIALAAWPGLALKVPALKPAALLALLPAGAYALLGGASTPTIRAWVMALCLASALLSDRPYRGSGALALAALVICLIWPHSPMELSFQLSFTAVAIIFAVISPLSAKLLAGRHRALNAIGGFFLLTFILQIALWPLSAASFHIVPWTGLAANLLAVPLVGIIILPLNLAAGMLAFPAPGLAQTLWNLAWHPAQWLQEIIAAMASLPAMVRYIAGPGLWSVILFYSGLLWLAAKPWPWKLKICLCGLFWAGATVIWLMPAQPANPGQLTAWVLDVGHGSCTILQLPQGQVVVVDGGGGWAGLDMGQRVIAPFLWSKGISRVDVLACSHSHPDHAGGLPFLARWFKPEQIWTNGEPWAPHADEQTPYSALLRQAQLNGAAILTPAQLSRGRVLGGATFRFPWPAYGPAPLRMDENDASLWVGVFWGDTSLWMPGDAGPKVERWLSSRLPQSKSPILIAPHHGGKGSCTPDLLARLNPMAVVYSSGCVNPFGMPRPESVQAALTHGAQVWTTAAQGCLELISNGQTWSMTPYFKEPRKCPLPTTPAIMDQKAPAQD